MVPRNNPLSPENHECSTISFVVLYTHVYVRVGFEIVHRVLHFVAFLKIGFRVAAGIEV